MTDLVVRIEMETPFATPLLSGTLFGHLCWAYRARPDGDSALTSWLDSLAQAPFLISNGFPRNMIPRPLLSPRRGTPDPDLDEIERRKKLKKSEFISLEAFLLLRGRMSETALAESLGAGGVPAVTGKRTAHNRIDRLTGRTPEAGGLFFVDEWWPREESRAFDVYVRSELPPSELEDLFSKVGEWGFGKDASTGRGRFRCKVEPEPSGLFQGAGSRRLSLSHGSLTANMRDPLYRLHPIYGKVGSTLSMCHSPFKFPMVLLRPGATFAPAGDGPFGEMLSQVHPSLDFVRQNAWHLTVPFSEEQ